MGLTSPLALVVAALVGLPVLAHLVRRADVERRVLPTVALLRKVSVEAKQRARITEPFLLALRVLAVFLATLALAGPFVVQHLAYGDGSTVALALVVDDSASMAQHASDSTAFELARLRAHAILDALGDGSEVALIASGSPSRIVVPRTSDLRALHVALDALVLGARETDLEGALGLANRQLASSRLGERRTVVISDFAALGDRTLEELAATRNLDPVAIVAETHPNVGISEARVSLDPLDPAARSAVVDILATHDERATVDLAVVASSAPRGPELAHARVAIERGHGRATLRFRAAPDTTHAVIRLVGAEGSPYADGSSFDDERVVSLRPPAPTRVALVTPTGSNAARFASRALEVASGDSGSFLVHTLDTDHLVPGRRGVIDESSDARSADALADLDVVVLVGMVPSAPTALESIRRFVENGGGLLLAASPSLAPLDAAPLADLLPARLSPAVAATSPLAPLSHGGFALLPSGPTGLESLRVGTRLGLVAPDERVALRFADGSPMLAVDAERRVAVLALGLDDVMSDLPLRVGFVPLVSTLAHALARPGALPSHPFVGARTPALRVPHGATRVDVLAPNGEVRTRDVTGDGVPLDDLILPGAYTFTAEVESERVALPRADLVIVPPESEIDLAPTVVPEPSHEGEQRSEGAARQPLDRWLFALVGLIAVLEGLARFVRPMELASRRAR